LIAQSPTVGTHLKRDTARSRDRLHGLCDKLRD